MLASVPLDDKAGSAHFRIILANSRLYMVLFVGQAGAAGRPQVDTYLKSFQIIPAEPQDGWKTFTASDGKFSVRMPGTPKEEVSDLAGGGGKIHQFALDKGDWAYIISYNSIGGGAPDAAAVPTLLDKGRDTMVTSLHGKLLEEKSLNLSGNPGREIHVDIPEKMGQAYVRGYIVGEQYFQVMLIGTNKALAGANRDRYFDSFKLPDSTADGEWANFASKEGRFSVDLPGVPKPEKLPDGTTKFQVESGDSVYIVVYVDLKSAVTEADAITRVLEASRDAEVKVLDGKIDSEKRITLADKPGLQVNLSLPDPKFPGGGSAIERYYLTGNRVYEVVVITKNPKLDEKEFARFLDSFKIESQ